MSISSGIITNFGNQVVCEHLYGNSTKYVLYIAIGTGTTTPTIYDTIMEAEYSRKLATVTDTGSRLHITINWANSEITDGTVISECGVFDALAGGNLVYHGVAAGCAHTIPGIHSGLDITVILTPETG